MDPNEQSEHTNELTPAEAHKFQHLLRKQFRFLPVAEIQEDVISLVARLRQIDRRLGRIAGESTSRKVDAEKTRL